MNITIKKYTIEEMNENHIIENDNLSLFEAENNSKQNTNNIFLVMNGIDSSIEKYPIESIDKDNNDFPIKENSEINKNEIDENAFSLDEDQKIGDNINNSVQINNQDNNNNHYYNNYQNINTPGNIYNINPIPYN